MDKMICIGKNYLKHAQELGDAVPEEPIYFIKPPSTLMLAAAEPFTVDWPGQGDLHHEVELALRISQDGGDWRFSHYTIGLDMTLRDVQARLKKAGQPWEKAKVFKNSAVLGPWQELSSLGELLEQEFSLSVNGQVRQRACGSEMRWKPAETLKDLQRWFPLCDGDVLFTGTPEGVGPLEEGDLLEVSGPKTRYAFTCRRRS